MNLKAETIARITQTCPNVRAIKEASGNFEQATALVNQKREELILLSGDDSLLLPLMAIGFDGVISVAANVVPQKYVELVKSMKEGQWIRARQLHLELAQLCRLLFAEGNPAGVKAALHASGIIRCNKLRLPLTPVSKELYQQLAACL